MLGNVSDEPGAAVPGATVTLTNVATGIAATAISESTGAYQFLNVRVGTYRIEAELQGFSKAVVPTVTVTVNARQRVDLTMKVGGIGETVAGDRRAPCSRANRATAARSSARSRSSTCR